MARKTSELIVGLDIGTSKICCIVGEATDEGIDIIGIGTHPSNGLRKGVAVMGGPRRLKRRWGRAVTGA